MTEWLLRTMAYIGSRVGADPTGLQCVMVTFWFTVVGRVPNAGGSESGRHFSQLAVLWVVRPWQKEEVVLHGQTGKPRS